MAVKYAWKNSLLICDASDDPDAVGGKVNYAKTQAAKKPSVASKFEVPF